MKFSLLIFIILSILSSSLAERCLKPTGSYLCAQYSDNECCIAIGKPGLSEFETEDIILLESIITNVNVRFSPMCKVYDRYGFCVDCRGGFGVRGDQCNQCPSSMERCETDDTELFKAIGISQSWPFKVRKMNN